jgi:hypothetical protein
MLALTLRLGFAVLGVTLLAAAPRLNAEQRTAPTENGWWIRINTAVTRATEIAWQFGTTSNALIASDTWRSGFGSDIVLADPLRLENFIHIRAASQPAEAPASFCVFWQQQGVALVEFAGTADRQLHISMNEPRCRIRLF